MIEVAKHNGRDSKTGNVNPEYQWRGEIRPSQPGHAHDGCDCLVVSRGETIGPKIFFKAGVTSARA